MIIYINGRFLTQKLKGVQRFAFEITKQLIELNKETFCVLVPDSEIDQAYDIGNFPIKTVYGLKGNLWEQISLPFYLFKLNGPLLLNFTNPAPAIYKKQIVCLHDVAFKYNPEWYSFFFNKWYNFLIPLLAKRSLRIITVSESSKADIIKYLNVDGEKIIVINNAVDSQFLMKKVVSYEILATLNIRPRYFFLAVSSMDPRKNFATLIHAYLSSSVTNIPLVIVGSPGRAFASIDVNLAELGSNIIFTGYIADAELLVLYKSALCFVYPSLYEGFGIPPLEAMLCGCPTIVSEIPSLKEVCGDASLYVDPLSLESISKTMSSAVSDLDLLNNLVEKGTQRVKIYNWKKSAEKLMQLIFSL